MIKAHFIIWLYFKVRFLILFLCFQYNIQHFLIILIPGPSDLFAYIDMQESEIPFPYTVLDIFIAFLEQSIQ